MRPSGKEGELGSNLHRSERRKAEEHWDQQFWCQTYGRTEFLDAGLPMPTVNQVRVITTIVGLWDSSSLPHSTLGPKLLRYVEKIRSLSKYVLLFEPARNLLRYCKNRLGLHSFKDKSLITPYYHPSLSHLTSKYNKDPAQPEILIRYSLEKASPLIPSPHVARVCVILKFFYTIQGYIPVPRSQSAGWIRSNADVFEFELTSFG